MAKRKQTKQPKQAVNPQATGAVETGRGQINDNFLAALVTSKVYKMQVVRAKKGKGAYARKDKHKKGFAKGQESYLIAA